MIHVNIGDALVSGTNQVTIPIGDKHGLYDLRNLKIVFSATQIDQSKNISKPIDRSDLLTPLHPNSFKMPS